jgi:hypothetical protein
LHPATKRYKIPATPISLRETLEAMQTPFKIGIVLAGYLLAGLAASAAVAVRLAHTQGPDAQASSGMHAFGDALLFMAAFGALALVPSGLALFYLRACRPFWTMLAIASLTLAMTGLLAACLYALGNSPALGPGLAFWASLAVLRVFPAPFLACGYLLSAVLAPDRSPRRMLLAATAIEGAAGLGVIIYWFASNLSI